MRENLLKLITSLVLLVAGTALGAFVQQRSSRAERQLRYLDYSTRVVKQLFDLPKLQGQQLELRLNSQPISNLSQVEVSVFNLSDRDFEKVPFYVELTSDAGQALQVIGWEALGPDRLPQAVRIVSPVPDVPSPKLQFEYEVGAVNRSGPENPVFFARYLLIGPASPTAIIRTNRVGLGLREFSYSRLFEPSSAERFFDIAFLPLLLAGYLTFFAVLRRFSLKRREKADAKLRQAFAGALSNVAADADPASAALLAFQQLRWDTIPKGFKWLAGIPKPAGREPTSGSE